MVTQQASRQLLTKTLQRIRRDAPIDLAFGGLVNASSTDVTLEETVGNETDALHNLDITPGHGLGGKALVLQQPTYVVDYHRAKGITHRYDAAVAAERMSSVFAIPITFSANRYGLLYGAQRSSAPLSDRLFDQVYSIINSVTHEHSSSTLLTEDPGDAGSAAEVTNQQIADIHAALSAIRDSVTEQAPRQRIEALLDQLSTSEGPTPPEAVNPLTRREIDVLSLAANGCTNNDIRARLGLELNTVKAYLRSVSRKLEARNRTDAVAIARRKQIIP